MNSKVKKIIITASLVVFSAVSIAGTELFQRKIAADKAVLMPAEERTVSFSKTGYIYDNTIKLKLRADGAEAVYYTLNGAEPDIEKAVDADEISYAASLKRTLRYTGPIVLEAEGNDINSYVIRAKAVYPDGEISETATHSYYIGKNADDRFSTLVFSITIDPSYLNDENFGIFAEGVLREQFLETIEPGYELVPTDPANYNIRGKAGERPAYIECFTADGDEIFSQKGGIRTYGGWSRSDTIQKSLKIFARKSYDLIEDDFDYPFFITNISEETNLVISKYKSLVLRNNANDRNAAYMRDEVISECARKAGFPDTQQAIPAAVYLNGRYYGFAWLHEIFDDEYLERTYGRGNGGTFAILQGTETVKNLDDDDFINVLRDLDPAALEEYEQLKENEEILPMTPEALRELLQSYATDEKIEAMINDSEREYDLFCLGFGVPVETIEQFRAGYDAAVEKVVLSLRYIQDYEEMYSYAYKDLTDDETFEELSQLIDIDNYLMYFAIESYVINDDWPSNNYKTYRYYPAEGEEADGAFDGKWRYMLYDSDFGLGLYGKSYTDRYIYNLMGLTETDNKDILNKKSPLFIALLERDDIKEKYVNLMCDLINFSFSPQSVKQTADQKSAVRIDELNYALDHGKCDSWYNKGALASNVSQITEFALGRPNEVLKQLSDIFSIERSFYTIKCTAPENTEISINTVRLTPEDGNFEGKYFDCYTSTVSARVGEGEEFDHWTVNGEKVYEPVLSVGALSKAEGTVKIELVTRPSVGGLKIAKVRYKGGSNDYIVLKNTSSEDISTHGYVISSSEGEKTAELPTMTLSAGEEITVYCKNYKKTDAIGGLSAPFSLKEGEIVSLLYGNKMIEDILLPEAVDSTAYVRDFISGEFFERPDE